MQNNHDYSEYVGYLNKDDWHNIINHFEDANIYQTWAYDNLRRNHSRIIHFILNKRGNISAAAQIRLYRIPILNFGIAYVFWGPMWKKKGEPIDPEIFRQAIRSMRNIFSVQKRLILRLYPLLYRKIDPEYYENILIEEEFYKCKEFVKRTLVLNLDLSLEELLASMKHKWRSHLKKAETQKFEIIIGDNEKLFNEIAKMYYDMVRKKALKERIDLIKLQRIQKFLPDRHKMKIIVCKLNGQLCSGGIFSALGNLGIQLVRATSEIGMKTYASYLVEWTYIKWLKENGFRYYDLNGINPEKNPGTYQFKFGLSGKSGIDTELLGKFETSDNKINSFIIRTFEGLLMQFKKGSIFRLFTKR